MKEQNENVGYNSKKERNRELQSRELLWWHSNNGRRYVAVIRAFLDESLAESGLLCVAGYAGDKRGMDHVSE